MRVSGTMERVCIFVIMRLVVCYPNICYFFVEIGRGLSRIDRLMDGLDIKYIL